MDINEQIKLEKIDALYERWNKAMGGDDPLFDNSFDDFLNCLDYEVAECETENDK